MNTNSFRLLVFLIAIATSLAQLTWSADPIVVDRYTLPNGRQIEAIEVPGSPPPAFKVQSVVLPAPNLAAGVNILENVPAFDWLYGCVTTSGAMIAGYYDNIGYFDVYTGPTNGGICPMNNAAWGVGECPLSVTHMGYDGRTTRGHVDDYWIELYSMEDDPYITNGWPEHTHADCTGDFMKTSQSAYGNRDGSTRIYYGLDRLPYTSYEDNDAVNGLRLFFLSRGYQVESHFTQHIYGYDGNTVGFTFEEFMAEIDAGRPVMIHVVWHTMVGFGYDSSTETIYIHDTWDHSDHEMTWGGSYAGRSHAMVSVIRLAPSPGIFQDGFETGDPSRWSSSLVAALRTD